MRVEIQDKAALQAISPLALAAYARSVGWKHTGTYGKYGDIYNGKGLAEIMVPRIAELDDYATVVALLIRVFADVSATDELAVYQVLLTYDRDEIRVRVSAGAGAGVGFAAAIDLLSGTRDMLLAAACSVQSQEPCYGPQERAKAEECLRGIRIGFAEQGGFAIVALTPAVAQSHREFVPSLAEGSAATAASRYVARPRMNVERQMAEGLNEALAAIQRMENEQGDFIDYGTLRDSVEEGVSAELCESLAKMAATAPALEISVAWARTHPLIPTFPLVLPVRLNHYSIPFLSLAARTLRAGKLRPAHLQEGSLSGFVERLERNSGSTGGAISLRTSVDGSTRRVGANLRQADYEAAIQAHRERAELVVAGKLERSGQQWQLLEPRVV